MQCSHHSFQFACTPVGTVGNSKPFGGVKVYGDTEDSSRCHIVVPSTRVDPVANVASTFPSPKPQSEELTDFEVGNVISQSNPASHIKLNSLAFFSTFTSQIIRFNIVVYAFVYFL